MHFSLRSPLAANLLPTSAASARCAPRSLRRTSSPLTLGAVLALAALPGAALAQFTDPFNSIDPAWVKNRYDPAVFGTASFLGDNRLILTIDQSGSTANRDVTFSDSFYNIQGRERAGGISGPWNLSAQVYVASSFNTGTGPLVQADLWGHTGTDPDGGAYLELGFTNASPTTPLNPAAGDRSFRFQALDIHTGNWINLGLPVGFTFDAWHTLAGTSTGSGFEYFIDGALMLSTSTTQSNDLLSAMIQGYNFGEAGSYSVHWDNVTASAVPEPATTALIAALVIFGLVNWRRRRQPA